MKHTFETPLQNHETDSQTSDAESDRSPSREVSLLAEQALRQIITPETPHEVLSREEWCNRIKSATRKLDEINKKGETLSGLALLDFLRANRSAYNEVTFLIDNKPAQDLPEKNPDIHPENQ